MTLRTGSICTGYGGLDMAVQMVLDAELAWVADPDPGAAAILAHHHPDIPNHGDIRTVDWSRAEPVDILTAGFPCQPVSNAGKKLGDQDERWLWPDVARTIRLLRPQYVLLENVASLLVRGFSAVSDSLANLGYGFTWTCLRASDVGAVHRRNRLFVVAHAAGHGRDARRSESARQLGRLDTAERGGTTPSHAAGIGHGDPGAPGVGGVPAAVVGGHTAAWGVYAPAIHRWEHVIGRPAPDPTEPTARGQRLSARFVEWLMGLDDGHVTAVPGLSRNQMLRALGNGVVPQQGTTAVRMLLERAR